MLDDATHDICVINTTLGLLKLLRLPRGMNKPGAAQVGAMAEAQK